jgi:high-affinity iron transporter
MFAAALIVFREVLEAALVITIVMAATRGLPRRNHWIGLGIMGGVVGAGLVAALTTAISAMFNGSGQDIVNAVILFTAVLLIGWHVVWMNSHGREIVSQMRAVGKSVADGEKHMSILAIVVGLAVLREGSEVVLMLQGLWVTGSSSDMVIGGTLGLLGGALTGALIYLGLLALPVGRVFALTNVILVLIAAGMAARGARFLVQADILPSFGNRIWDTSGVLSDQSVVGQMCAGLIGYIAKPSGIELTFYVATIFVVLMLMFYADALAKRAAPKRI